MVDDDRVRGKRGRWIDSAMQSKQNVRWNHSHTIPKMVVVFRVSSRKTIKTLFSLKSYKRICHTYGHIWSYKCCIALANYKSIEIVWLTECTADCMRYWIKKLTKKCIRMWQKWVWKLHRLSTSLPKWVYSFYSSKWFKWSQPKITWYLNHPTCD